MISMRKRAVYHPYGTLSNHGIGGGEETLQSRQGREHVQEISGGGHFPSLMGVRSGKRVSFESGKRSGPFGGGGNSKEISLKEGKERTRRTRGFAGREGIICRRLHFFLEKGRDPQQAQGKGEDLPY